MRLFHHSLGWLDMAFHVSPSVTSDRQQCSDEPGNATMTDVIDADEEDNRAKESSSAPRKSIWRHFPFLRRSEQGISEVDPSGLGTSICV